MTSPGARLTEQLHADMQALQQAQNDMSAAVQRQTSQLLKQHESALKALSSAALRTTERVMAAHQKTLTQMHSEHQKRLRLALLWPLAATAILSLLILAATTTWAWLRLTDLQQEVAQRRALIARLESEFCASPAGKTTCKPLN